MYLFHGTCEQDAMKIIRGGFRNIEDIQGSPKWYRKIFLTPGGLYDLPPAYYNWYYFLGPVNFFSTDPCLVGLTWEERRGSSPLRFAKWAACNCEETDYGSLIVIKIPPEEFEKAIVRIYHSSDVEKYYPGEWENENAKNIFEELDARKLKTIDGACQVLVNNHLVNNYILFGFRICHGKRLVGRFNPKYQDKSKHKSKDKSSLIWHEIKQLEKQYKGKPFYRKYQV